MVRGVDLFKERFADYNGQYVFIGGAACDIILGREGVDFRATKDLDIVLIIEALSEDFVSRFAAFIEEGKYQHINKGTGQNQFYRFMDPKDRSFPIMIELFSRRPDYLKTIEARLSPIHVSDDVMSLSAILLDDAYYALLKNGIITVNGVSVLDIEYLILFKIKAWLDLSKRKDQGEPVDSRDIKKHKNDVLRLAANLSPEKRLDIKGQIREDAMAFVDDVAKEKIVLRDLGIHGAKLSDIIERITFCYGLN